MKTGMKRFMAALGIGAMAVMMLAGCGNGVNDGKDSTAADSKDKTTMTVEEVAKEYRPRAVGFNGHGWMKFEKAKGNSVCNERWTDGLKIINDGHLKNGDTAKITFPEKVTVRNKDYKITGKRTLNWTVTGLHQFSDIKSTKAIADKGQDFYCCPAKYPDSTVALAKLYVGVDFWHGTKICNNGEYPSERSRVEVQAIYKVQKKDGSVVYEPLVIRNVKLRNKTLLIDEDSDDGDADPQGLQNLDEAVSQVDKNDFVEIPIKN
mgnify:CR=1 FL=1